MGQVDSTIRQSAELNGREKDSGRKNKDFRRKTKTKQPYKRSTRGAAYGITQDIQRITKELKRTNQEMMKNIEMNKVQA